LITIDPKRISYGNPPTIPFRLAKMAISEPTAPAILRYDPQIASATVMRICAILAQTQQKGLDRSIPTLKNGTTEEKRFGFAARPPGTRRLRDRGNVLSSRACFSK
jgi:hypothetical protein